jgi:hypothetical protein
MSAPQPALSQIRAAMATTNNLFNTEVFGKRNFQALDSVYTANATILPPGAIWRQFLNSIALERTGR